MTTFWDPVLHVISALEQELTARLATEQLTLDDGYGRLRARLLEDSQVVGGAWEARLELLPVSPMGPDDVASLLESCAILIVTRELLPHVWAETALVATPHLALPAGTIQ
jgi:hypothetical protein